MGIIDYFRTKKPKTASLAKERLQIIVAHERNNRGQPDYIPQLQKELLEVISKYVKIDLDQIKCTVDNSNDCSVLELNVTLNESGG